MKQNIDSTLYFFQFIVSRLSIVTILGVLIFSIIINDIKGVIACIVFLIFALFMAIKVVPRPSDLKFDNNFIYLNKLPEPLEISKITSLENGVLIYNVDGKISKISLPTYYYTDKNYKNLRKVLNATKPV